MKKLTLKEIRKNKKFLKAQRLIKKVSNFSLAHTYGEKSAVKIGGKYSSKGITPDQAKTLYAMKILNSIRNSIVEEYPKYKHITKEEVLNLIMNMR